MKADESDWETTYAESSSIFSALANPLRVAICHCLIREPHSVSELHGCLNVSQPLASHHLKILKEANIVTSEQRGRSTYYAITDKHIRHILLDTHEHTKENTP